MDGEKKTLKLFQKKKVIPKYVLPENPSFDTNDSRNFKKSDPFETASKNDIFAVNIDKRTKGSIVDEFVVDEASRGVFLGGELKEFNELDKRKEYADLFGKEDTDFDDTKVDDLGLAAELLTYKKEAPKWKPTTLFEEPQEKQSLDDEQINKEIERLKNEGEKLIKKYTEDELDFLNTVQTQQKTRTVAIDSFLSDIDDLEKKFSNSPFSSNKSNKKEETVEIAMDSIDDINAYILKQSSSSSQSRGLFD